VINNIIIIIMNISILLLGCMDGSVRLVDGDNYNATAGRVEYCVGGLWGTVCNYEWSLGDATVVCRQLGLNTFGKIIQPSGDKLQKNYLKLHFFSSIVAIDSKLTSEVQNFNKMEHFAAKQWLKSTRLQGYGQLISPRARMRSQILPFCCQS
jgi:hypothetical protein